MWTNAQNSTIGQIAFFAVIFAVNTSQALAQDWTQWLGPNRDGRIPAQSVPGTLSEKPDLIWETTVGGGYSSPLIFDDQVFVHTRIDEQEVVACLDLKTGKQIWRKTNAAPMQRNQYAVKHGKGPFATPAIHSGKLFTVGVTGVLTCFDIKNGNVLWRKVYKESGLNTEKFFCGNTVSPLIYKNMCITFIGDDDAGALTAYDVETGEEVWSWKEDNPGYASPILVTSGGVAQIVTLSQNGVIGVSAENGKLLWQIPFVSEWKENIPSPVFFDDMIIYSGVGRGTMSVKLEKSNGGWKTTELWQNKEISMYMNSPVLHEAKLFGLSQKRRGQFFSLDAKTGKTFWTNEGREGANASLFLGGDSFYSLTTEGVLKIFEATSEAFRLRGELSLAETSTWATPAFVENHILIKAGENLRLFAAPRKTQ